MHTLYPPIKPYQRHELPVSGSHTLYVEEVGNPDGIPLIYLHAGPGSGGDTGLRRMFDPQVYRIVLFDQRGCGRSSPHLELSANSTPHLLDDIDAVRDYLGIERFVISGAGWGSLLALLYAEQNPTQISAILLQQIFLGRQKDIDWVYKSGANLMYPDYWQEFIHPVPLEQQGDLISFYDDGLKGENELVRMSLAKNWASWKARCASFLPHLNLMDQFSNPHFALGLATLETHYLKYRYFIEENQVLNQIDAIKHIPTWLIHGRFDMVCPLINAWELHAALPNSKLSIVRDAGHSDRETGIIDAFISATIDISGRGLDAC